MNILVAEQDEWMREAIPRFLREVGYKVTTAVSTAEIMVKLEGTAVDLLLVGHRPSQLDGTALVNQVNVPLVATTMPGADFAGFQSSEVSAVLASPFEMEELLDAVAQLLA